MHPRRIMTIAAVAFFVVGLVFVRFDTGMEVPAVSTAFVVILALPSYVALWRWLGAAKAFFILLVFSILPLLVEGLAVATGFPYGSFSYAGTLGEPLFGLVPWTVSFAYLPMLLGAVTLASRLVGTDWRRFIPATAFLVVAIDLVIDPAAVHAGFWIWDGPGVYYGIPAVNFLGWAITGTVYAGLFFLAVRGRFEQGEAIPLSVAGSMLLILSFWSGYLLREFLVIPVVVGLGLIGLIGYAYTKDG
ncbi:carotenoid biosynthesis protein [Methanogenium marinum]|uniref:Carotenoid biosynthesis protein n=1 Tax=Methanogenium marinum TaxID=348610 RepID=A0A9Q4PW96_9EURY|nr:carotenoid biosynthesis protein [Methanogenium marinum]MDE4908845.1 carotenoid biosynthesis protein [Methanogenium marinum]